MEPFKCRKPDAALRNPEIFIPFASQEDCRTGNLLRNCVRPKKESAMTCKSEMRELTNKELDAVCGGGFGVSTGNVWAHQKNVAVVVGSDFTKIYQTNIANSGYIG
jgi:hypothetical protein